jgi:hypothetical protein
MRHTVPALLDRQPEAVAVELLRALEVFDIEHDGVDGQIHGLSPFVEW